MWKQFAVLCSRATAWSLALATSLMGWIPYFTGVSYDVFLAATAAIGLVIAACIS